MPFQQNFSKITGFQEKVYFATLLLTAISAVLLISPSAYHRMTFRMQQKDDLVFLANKLAIAGLAFLALAMTGAIMLITDVLFGTAATIVTSALALAMFALFWAALPLQRRVSSRRGAGLAAVGPSGAGAGRRGARPAPRPPRALRVRCAASPGPLPRLRP